jgi:signal transduction histidine kinase
MRERAALSGGELEIHSGPERGTNVRLRVPLPREVLE